MRVLFGSNSSRILERTECSGEDQFGSVAGQRLKNDRVNEEFLISDHTTSSISWTTGEVESIGSGRLKRDQIARPKARDTMCTLIEFRFVYKLFFSI